MTLQERMVLVPYPMSFGRISEAKQKAWKLIIVRVMDKHMRSYQPFILHSQLSQRFGSKILLIIMLRSKNNKYATLST